MMKRFLLRALDIVGISLFIVLYAIGLGFAWLAVAILSMVARVLRGGSDGNA